MLRITLAVVHLLALGIGLGAIFTRARASRRLGEGSDALRKMLAADNAWGIAALLWIGTGLWRWLAGVEKPASYYWSNHIFLGKMSLLVLVLLLEVWPMVTLINWRIAGGRGTLPPIDDLARRGRRIARISDVQTLLIVAMVAAAAAMARGYGSR